MKDLVIIPLFNERETVEATINKIRRLHGGDILVVDDGSDDGSSEIIGGISGIDVHRHCKNKGYGASLNDGFDYAIRNRYDRVVTCDCDEQHEPAMIKTLFDSLGDNDILSGSRYLIESDNDDAPPEQRHAVNKIITKMVNELTGFGLTDAFCGFKSYTVSALSRLSLSETGYSQPLQMWIQAKALNFKVSEIAVPRIYKNLNRTFGEELDNKELRLKYYKNTLCHEILLWPNFSHDRQKCSASERGGA